MKIQYYVRQSSSSGRDSDPTITVYVTLGLILDGSYQRSADLHFQAQAAASREALGEKSGNVYINDGLDLEPRLIDFFFGPFLWTGLNIDNTIGLVVQNTDKINRLLKRWAKVVDDANLYYRHGHDMLAIWIDALARMGAEQVNSEYDKTPVLVRAFTK